MFKTISTSTISLQLEESLIFSAVGDVAVRKEPNYSPFFSRLRWLRILLAKHGRGMLHHYHLLINLHFINLRLQLTFSLEDFLRFSKIKQCIYYIRLILLVIKLKDFHLKLRILFVSFSTIGR